MAHRRELLLKSANPDPREIARWSDPYYRPRDSRGRAVITQVGGSSLAFPVPISTALAGSAGVWGAFIFVLQTDVIPGNLVLGFIAAAALIPGITTEYFSRKRHPVLPLPYDMEIFEQEDDVFPNDEIFGDELESAIVDSLPVKEVDSLEDRHSRVITNWMEYELDPILALSYPAMVDYSVPQTVALYQKLDNAHALRKVGAHGAGGSYRTAVQELEVAFKAAEGHARKTGTSMMTPSEQIKVEKAQKLLALALSESASIYERQGAYNQALSTLKGVMILPTKLTERVETSIKQIRSTPEER